jgi:hypothetical protein
MKTFLGIVLGFALLPAMLGLVALFVWANIRLGTNRVDVVIGATSGMCVLVLGFLIAVKLWGP